jgi:hypothetical protein
LIFQPEIHFFQYRPMRTAKIWGRVKRGFEFNNLETNWLDSFALPLLG